MALSDRLSNGAMTVHKDKRLEALLRPAQSTVGEEVRPRTCCPQANAPRHSCRNADHRAGRPCRQCASTPISGPHAESNSAVAEPTIREVLAAGRCSRALNCWFFSGGVVAMAPPLTLGPWILAVSPRD